MQNRIVTSPSGDNVYVTIDGDMIDAIAHAHYGQHGRNTEVLLNANRHLSAYGPILPAGVGIRLPAAAPKTAIPMRRLWD